MRLVVNVVILEGIYGVRLLAPRLFSLLLFSSLLVYSSHVTDIVETNNTAAPGWGGPRCCIATLTSIR